MIDYDKLKLAHELAEKQNIEVLYTYNNGLGYVCWVTLDQLITEVFR